MHHIWPYLNPGVNDMGNKILLYVIYDFFVMTFQNISTLSNLKGVNDNMSMA